MAVSSYMYNSKSTACVAVSMRCETFEVQWHVIMFLLANFVSQLVVRSPVAFRKHGVEYVMDYIMERKRVDDLHQSIKDRRYDKQKYNMQRCGLRHLIYLVEGDPDTLGDESGEYTPTYTNNLIPLPSPL